MTALLEVTDRVEVLWQFVARRLQIAGVRSSPGHPRLGGHEPEPSGGNVTRERIEESLADANGAYRRLRRVMDAWAALWFWPLTETETKPPTFAQWLDALQQLLGRNTKGRKSPTGMDQLGTHLDWDALGLAEEIDLGFADAKPVANVLDAHPWLRVCEDVADQQGFFHWELDFATVFARGGFDLQLGNPPWVRPIVDTDALLAEGDPWWQLAHKPSEAARSAQREETLQLPGIRGLLLDGVTDVVATAAYLGNSTSYPFLAGLQPDLHRCFMSQTWRHLSTDGTVGLIHPESHFTEERAGLLRSATYTRLRRHWQFVNELQLFDIGHPVIYGVHIYGRQVNSVRFLSATSLYHPDTAERSLRHDGSGAEPGLRDPDGGWDLRPHSSRLIEVDEVVLAAWHSVLENPEVPVMRTRMLYTVNQSAANVLEKLATRRRFGEFNLRYSAGWHEKSDRARGRFELGWGEPASWDDVILQGPHLHVGNPIYKHPNPTMRSKGDWSAIDLEKLSPKAIPITAYKPIGDRYAYDCAYTDWGDDRRPRPARDYYRIAWRRMAALTNERTLIPALIPPGSAHVHPVSSAGSPDASARDLAIGIAVLSALVSDFGVRAAPKYDIYLTTLDRLPCASPNHPLINQLILRAIRLNCVTQAYAEFWRGCYTPQFAEDSWAGGEERVNRPRLGDLSRDWTPTSPLRIAEDRRRALVEIDALVALMLGVSIDELCSVYRAQFGVLVAHERSNRYDGFGRLVPNQVATAWLKKGALATAEDRTATNQAGNTYTYELPFRLLDREADMRQAYAHFERILDEKTQQGEGES